LPPLPFSVFPLPVFTHRRLYVQKKGCARTRLAYSARALAYNNFVAAFSFPFTERPPFTSQECILPAKTQIWVFGQQLLRFFFERRKVSVFLRPVLGLVPPPPIWVLRDLVKYGKGEYLVDDGALLAEPTNDRGAHAAHVLTNVVCARPSDRIAGGDGSV
jgi:hypothetical protein